jgi:hypothetical protein
MRASIEIIWYAHARTSTFTHTKHETAGEMLASTSQEATAIQHSKTSERIFWVAFARGSMFFSV